MALGKRIELASGIAVSYHRVASVNIVTNRRNVVEVASYTSQAKREEEKAALADRVGMDVFIDTSFVSAEYDQTMTVEGAYGWLKANVPDFADAEDILEN